MPRPTSFAELGVPAAIVEALSASGITQPFAIQAETIPDLADGRDVIGRVRLYGEMHRFVPIYASWQGARVTEIPVNHRPRRAGRSKYGLERILKVVLDLMVGQGRISRAEHADAVEESLRYDAPNQGLFRHTTRDVELHGVTIPAGKKVLLLFGAAGRDPSHFPDSERFDIARSPNRHIAFGAGIHHCLGANIGRLEANIALETAVSRIAELRLVDTQPAYVPIFFIRCPEHLRVQLAEA